MNFDRDRAEKVMMAGVGFYMAQRLDEALRQFEHALKLFRTAGPDAAMALCLSKIGNVHHDKGNHQLALTYFQDGLAIDQRFDDGFATATAMINVAGELELLGRSAEATQHYTAAVMIAEAM